jgi:putative transposase
MEKMVEVQRATQDELRQELRALFQGAIRSRGQGSPVDVLGRYQRRAEEIDEMIAEAYVGGVSQRKMGEVTEALMGESVGRSTVSRVAKRLDQAVHELRKQPIEGPHPYLYLDATFLDARWARKVENVSALMAYAVGPDGRRRLLGITLGSEESEDSWAELLDQLVDRGLSGVQLVIADGHAGLAAAVRRFLPEARQQRCTVHLVRNVTAKVPRRLRKRVAREVGAIFQAPSLGEAKKRLAEVRARWATELPEAMEVLERGFGAATQFYAFPKAHWPRLRTTNGLERLHAEVKRRIRAVGAFPDRASALRLITAVALRATEAWASRRYLDVSLLEKQTEGAAKAA